ncbi:hypothetical protein ACIRRH_39630 [Kitasatospora sp. NPDC101235]|uniref:hypothetical protein n=1 Tax=Kitasatospora sp. NPDC101235 TaxID=3364101 RepID=UPI003821CC75
MELRGVTPLSGGDHERHQLLRLLDREVDLLQHAQDLYAAHADLTWNQAVDGAAMQLGYLQPPHSGNPHGFPRGFRIDALAPAGAQPTDRVDGGPGPTG